MQCVQTPAGYRTVPRRCHFTLNDPSKCRTGAMELLIMLSQYFFQLISQAEFFYEIPAQYVRQ